MEKLLLCCGLLLLCAALGAVWGRAFPGARTPAMRGIPICLLLGLAGALVWPHELLWLGMHYGLNILLTRMLLLLLAAVAAIGAILCAFRPTQASCAVAALGAVLWLVYTAYGLLLKYLVGLGDLSSGLLVLTIVGAVATMLAFMGLFCKGPALATTPETQQASPVPLQPVAPAGWLTILCGAFAGQQLPIPAEEEFTLGSDATQCHLILEQPGIPPCLCSVRWLEERNTYLISSHAPEGLLYGTGERAPSGSTVEVFPQTICYLPATEQPVIQVG